MDTSEYTFCITHQTLRRWQSTTESQEAIRWCDSPIEVFHEDHAWKTSTA